MTTPRHILGCLAASSLVFAGTAGAAIGPEIWYDLGGDVQVRKTDANMTAVPGPGCTLPNLLKLTIGGWESNTASTNPYNGCYVDPEDAHLLRFDLELKGVVNPPGSVALSSYNPFEFGPSPLYGAVELDVDGNRDSGGEIGMGARTKFLANIGRFGRLPYGSISSRAVRVGWQIDADFFTPPYFERSGADFLLTFCGCYPTTIVSETGTPNQIFEAGETWIIRGGFFQRAGGYQSICSSTGGAAGLQVGQYVPYVNLRWSHSIASNVTTVTLVFAATMTGAGQLAGQPAQPINLSASDQASLAEALSDLVNGAPGAPAGSPVAILSQAWIGRNPTDSRYRDPDRWSVSALVGTASVEPVGGAVFIWTDTGFKDTFGDLDGNSTADNLDRAIIISAIDSLDGSPWDAGGNGREDGAVLLVSPGINFALADVDGNGSIDRLDVNSLCPGDFNRDGFVNILDYLAFFDAYTSGNPSADLNANGIFDAGDFLVFMNAAASGCS